MANTGWHMLNTMEWQLETLPGSGIWTGSADHTTMTGIKGTSLLGGMRFWTEALLRSFGYRVCDCTGKGKDIFKKASPEKVCAACHSFGCTGLSRAFSLHVTPENMTEHGKKTRVIAKAPGRDDANYAVAPGWQGRLALSMTCRRPLSWPLEMHWGRHHAGLPPEVLLATLLMLEYGALGASDQYGCGLVRLRDRAAVLEKLRGCPLPEDCPDPVETGLASLRDFFFFKGSLDQKALERQSNCRITTPGIPPALSDLVRARRLLRDSLRGQQGIRELRHWLCGTLRPQPVGGHMSLGISDKILYGWGWLPRKGMAELSGPGGPSLRETALQAVHDCVQGICPGMTWKEFASPRDARAPQTWREHVTEMLSQPWRDA